MRVDGRKPEGPDVDWIHLPDPVGDANRDLSGRLGAIERRLADLGAAEDPAPGAPVRQLRSVRGQNPSGG